MEKRTQKDRWNSSWSLGDLVKRQIFVVIWALTCAWTPKKLYLWRNFILRIFGAKISGSPFVASSTRIYFPWNLSLEHKSCIAERVNVYNLAKIHIGVRAVVSQDAFLCCGSHDFDSPKFELTVAPISIASDVFIGARAIILPGCHVGEKTIVGAGSVVTKILPAASVVAGNPARLIKERAEFPKVKLE
jgi:putative colanic acid biosynthesis acetyltransferase WcaF